MPRSARNKTIVLTDADAARLEHNLVTVEQGKVYDAEQIIDKTLLGDMGVVVEQLPSGFADLIIIDPPYNLTKRFGDVEFKARGGAEYEEYLRSWFGSVVRLLKPNGSLYMCGDWHCGSAMQRVIEEQLTLINRITWQREKGRGASSNWKNGMEDIWFAVKDVNNYYFDLESVKVKRRVVAPYKEAGKAKGWQETKEGRFRLTCPSNFWDDITVPYWSMAENTDHPTQKPEKLIAKLILASCPKGGVVFDPFLGSGTTSVVAHKLGRHYCGIEIDKTYALISELRLEKAAIDNRIQGFADGVFWERNTSALQKKI